MRYARLVLAALVLADLASGEPPRLKRKLSNTNGIVLQTRDEDGVSERDLMGLKFSDLSFWSIYSQNDVGSVPTLSPAPTKPPTKAPTEPPTVAPVAGPTTPAPTGIPSKPPTQNPTTRPSQSPTVSPSRTPTERPSTRPSFAPVTVPTTESPTRTPTKDPTAAPTIQASSSPSLSPSGSPTKAPTKAPTKNPTKSPTKAPTRSPTIPPTKAPTKSPTKSPTKAPTRNPTPQPTAAPFAQTVIFGAALGGVSDFNDPNSYQSCALARSLQQDGINGQSEAKIIQYYALFTIYCSTNGVPNAVTDQDSRFDNLVTFPQWTSQSGWTENNVNPCDYYGIICFSDQVVLIDLSSNRLTGVFPPEVKLLASDGAFSTGAGSLIALDLSNNEFVFNNFDTSWLSDLGTAMESVDFTVTSFAGNFPRFPTGLFEIIINFTLYDGGLTNANFAGLNNLNYLEISGNSFNQPMPTVLNQLNSLEQIFVEDSAITGGLDFMVGMPLIFQVWIDKNPAFGGTIPSEIGDLNTLASWSITENNFSGTMPTELGKLTNMQRLWMYGNNLTGNVPSELGTIIKLELLRVEDNAFTGTMPDEVCNLRNDFLSSLSLLGSVCGGTGNPQCTCCDCCDAASCDAL